ncbi:MULTISPECIES: transcription antitermination factor NusB [Cyanophyceae]|uniref:Transcription antitermination protein NusB n=1 Tax=Picosynechococcus sp. (strain ATCC 27264 / PCC 7002 / PR-6) TaxID=32049 RepID=NUSB_PICP2|nr:MULTISPECIES: transcription antitermination factor NusB [Cyanophyceae]B1XIZ3.1 RecName: Full=Transcription antitermination protein NusB; AltName: Full=Antitermination factor NusB [Picosynechococcus sp. PCC 7002]ACA98935.1 transcription antitermination factor NusB [Picosynechococcus sp. PCC 7002]AMA08694.1 N utilization substance protein B [Picosynechococcus sp. PCC 73109]ANV89995.1 transcription antitermination factor NusB [Picosynechococcus sp. PCC 8807]QCS49528.1 transcription antitermina
MPARKQPRSVAREIALLSLSQIKGKPDKLEAVELDELMLAAVRTLSSEIHDILEDAASEVSRAEEQLLRSETLAVNVKSARTMAADALELTRAAINRLGHVVELPEFLQLTRQHEVRNFALEILTTLRRRNDQIKEVIDGSLVDWQYHRLPRLDRDILRIAVAEILFLETPYKVAINEAVELAKRYSDEDGHRFINGVLRRVSDRLRAEDSLK